FLQKHPRVERVFFPGLKRHAKHALTKQFRASGLIMPSHSRARRPSWHGRLRHAQVRSPLPTGVAPVARPDELWRGKSLRLWLPVVNEKMNESKEFTLAPRRDR